MASVEGASILRGSIKSLALFILLTSAFLKAILKFVSMFITDMPFFIAFLKLFVDNRNHHGAQAVF